MTLRFICFWLFSCLPLAQVWGVGGYFNFHAGAEQVYQQIVCLRLTEARISLDRFKRTEPENLISVFLEDYFEFMLVVANDNKEEFSRLSKFGEKRLVKLAGGDRKSPYYLYTQAEVRLHWALLRMRYGWYVSAMRESRLAYNLLIENQRRFPTFAANKKSLGIMHAMVGSIPEEFQWGIKLLSGMEGNISKGVGELAEVVRYGSLNAFHFAEESVVSYAFVLLFFDNNAALAWKVLREAGLKPQENPMAAFALSLVAMRSGHNDTAIGLLAKAPRGGAYHPFYILDYLLGLAKLRRLDRDADRHLLQFTRVFKGENGIKEAYQRLAWHCLIHKDRVGYDRNMALVRSLGNSQSDADKVALQEAKSGEVPEEYLLRGRLLFDGGYYQRAFDILKPRFDRYKNNLKQELEYCYRMGRVTQKLDRTAEAVAYFERTISLGSQKSWYFACNSALQLGLIYEQEQYFGQSRAAFKRCLSLQPDSYGSGLHAQAKAGLARIDKK